MWNPPGGTLGRIVGEARQRVAALRGHRFALEAAIRTSPPAPSFVDALRAADVSVIAEVKRRSPSKGAINTTIDAAGQARAYRDGGARAISVLTEGAHFGGSAEDLEEIRAVVGIPLLKKDFHIDPLQVLEARALRASALLLIARAVSPAALVEMAKLAHEIGIEPLVEVRDERELESALTAGARVVGVNTRNLETLVMEPAVCERIVPLTPASVIAIYESGVKDRSDVERAAAAGADAVLVGSAVSASPDPSAAVRALLGVARVPRG
ncbi:MAG: indole-3-glycerol-phosphate synthase [Gemmatimonadaceae bacterium]|nr:indole-3-glycerol-phosphate synthase [Gemmatimonadaceae bacterium]